MNKRLSTQAQRAMTQDYWVQVVTSMTERAELISSAPKSELKKYTPAEINARPMKNYYLLLDYIFETRRDAVIAYAEKLQSELNAILNS